MRGRRKRVSSVLSFISSSLHAVKVQAKITIATVISSSVDIVLIVSFIFIPCLLFYLYFSLISTSLYSVEVCSSNSGLKSSE